MRYFKSYASFLVLNLFLGGCGDSSSDDAAREFGKAIDKVDYSLARTDLNIKLGAGSGTIQELNSSIGYLPGKSKDKILRLIDGSNFKLQVNSVEALIPVSSQENINHEQQILEDFQSCRIVGNSNVNGQATSLRINLRWNLSLRLEGESCEAFVPKFQAFLQGELARFNLTVVKDLLKATDLLEADQREVNINLSLTGESN